MSSRIVVEKRGIPYFQVTHGVLNERGDLTMQTSQRLVCIAIRGEHTGRDVITIGIDLYSSIACGVNKHPMNLPWKIERLHKPYLRLSARVAGIDPLL